VVTGERAFNDDFLDALRCLAEAGARFVVVGAHALAAHGVPRATGDIDLFVEPSAENARKVISALHAFGAPLESHGLNLDDLTRPGTVYQIGLPPRRIDLLTGLSGVAFDDAWASRVSIEVDGLPIDFLGREALILNKRATGRAKDLADLALLERPPTGA
jgi:hypothetical protein